MIHLTSLLVCLMSAGSHVQTAQNFKTSEAWPSSGWLPPGALAGPQPHGSIKVLSPKSLKPYPVRNPDGSRGPAQNSHMHNPVINPKTFRIQFQTDNNNEHDHEHDHTHPSHVHPGKDLGSHPHANIHTGSSNYPKKKQNPGFQLSFSVPFPTTTASAAAPTAPSNENTGFSYWGPSQNNFFHNPFKIPGINNPSDPTQVVQKPLQSKLVTFLNGLLQKGQHNENSQINSQAQQNKVFFKPPHSQSGFSSNPQSPSNWAAHMHVAGSTDAESDVQAPVHQAGQTPMYYPPQWYLVHKPPMSNEDLRKGILQSVRYVNGQPMIPMEKCPGFEKFAAILKGHYHGHHYGPPFHGHAHQYESTYYGHLHQHRLPSDIYQHGRPSHDHIHQHGYVYQHGRDQQQHYYHGPQTKPNQASYFLNVQGTVPSPTEPPQQTRVQGHYVHQHGHDHQNGYYRYHELQTKPSQASYFLNVQGTVPSPTEPPQQIYVQGPDVHQQGLHPPVYQHGQDHQNGYLHYHGPHTNPTQARFFLNIQGTVSSPTESPQETTVQPWGPPVHPHGQHSHGHVYQHWQRPHVHRYNNAHYNELQTKPKHAYFFDVQGTAQSSTEPPQEANVQLWGEYHKNPFRWWQTAPQASKPMHKKPEKQQSDANHVVRLGANMEDDKKLGTQSQSNFHYGLHRQH